MNLNCQTPGDSVRQETPLASCSAAKTATSCGPTSAEISTIKQVAAAGLILGQNVTKTAEALGVDRRTVQRWEKFDPEFREALQDAKLEAIITSRQSLLALAEEAVAKVETKLTDEQSPRVALALLRGMGIVGSQSLVPPSFTAESENEKRAQSATLEKKSATKKAAQKNKADENARQSATSETDPPADAETDAVQIEEPIYEWSDLSIEQMTAMQHLYEGKPLAEVAELSSTTAETVRNWLCRDNCFFTLLSGLQFERVMHLKHRLLSLTTSAIDIIRDAIQQKNDTRIAIAFLRGMGIMG